MDTEKKKQLIEQLRTIRFGGDSAKSVIIIATSGDIEIKNPKVINNVLDYLLKELKMDMIKELEE